MPAKDRLERKKCKDMWRWESELKARMLSRFLSTDNRYLDRKSPKRKACCSRSSGRLMKKNSETCVRLCGSV